MATLVHCLGGMGRKPILCLNCRSVVSDDCCLVPLPQLSATVDEIEAHGNVGSGTTRAKLFWWSIFVGAVLLIWIDGFPRWRPSLLPRPGDISVLTYGHKWPTWMPRLQVSWTIDDKDGRPIVVRLHVGAVAQGK